MGNSIPSSGLFGGAAYTIEGEPESQWKLKFSMFAIIDGDYFQAMGIPLREGRFFTANDRASAPPVIIVNESMAKHRWPGQSAIGKRMHVGNPHKGLPWATVVGVVGDTKGGSRDEDSRDEWYAPEQQPAILFGNDYKEELAGAAGGFIVVRSNFAPRQMIETVRAAVAEIDPHLALQQVQPMNDVMAGVEAPRRFNTDVISGFALGALLLAVTGIYAVVAFSVSMRAQEIAIRLALGAQRGNIARLVLMSGAKLGLAGCALGVVGSLATARLVKSFLFGVSATEPPIYVAGVTIILVLVLVASALPAIRAAAADPIEALRAT
jgi:putative ABC transport system permease protein